MFEISLWKSSTIVTSQVYQFFPKRNSWFTGVFYIFEAFILGLKCHKTYFAESLWVDASDFHVFIFHFFFNIVNRAEGVWSLDN